MGGFAHIKNSVLYTVLVGVLAVIYAGALVGLAGALGCPLEYFALAVGAAALLLALFLQVLKLWQISHNKIKELNTLSDVSRLVSSTLNIQEIYGSIIKAVIQVINVDRGILFLYNDQAKELRSEAGYGAEEELLLDITLQVENSVLGRIFKEGKPRLVPHTTRNTEYVKRLGADTYVAVPMKAKEKVIGLFTIDNARTGRPLANLNMDLLMALAGQMAVAIENARLYEDAQEKIKELSRLNRVSSLGTMVAGIAHEIKNPLTALDMCVQLLDASKGSQQFWNEFGPVIGAEIKRLKAIVEEFLNFARTPEIKMQTVELKDIAGRVFNLVRPQAGQDNVELVLNIEDGLKIRVDAQKFTQVVLNMLLNSIQAMPPNRPFKGYIELGARRDPFNSKVNITIRDNGAGIAKEDQEKLFQPFFTTKQKGTGLGLSIAAKIIEEHGGAIKVESQVNFGTTFTIQLPLVKARRPAESMARSA
ncbi:MAG: GAF domain-containing protein [Candidatus Margulisbacteria bacterium]|nr:GAF domain-containing protein [Candidatus Margulisiibacteriota bacterium]